MIALLNAAQFLAGIVRSVGIPPNSVMALMILVVMLTSIKNRRDAAFAEG